VDTRLVYGDVPVAPPVDAVRLPDELITDKVRDNLVLALQMVNNLVKHARRGHTWRAADHARHADKCLANATWLLNHGTEPGYAAGKTTVLPEPVRNDAGGIRMIARTLLAAVKEIATRADLTQSVAVPVAAMHVVIDEWEHAAYVPPDEYYRSLPRRRLGARVLITDAGGRVLVLETTYKQTYEVPGGVCEAGESPRTAAMREVREELGLELDIGRLLVFDHRSEPDPKGDAIMLVYDGGTISNPSSITVDGSEISSFRFVDPADLERFTTARMATRLRAALDARWQERTIEINDGVVVPS
jgi:ADP-ribose pyrophosphatase YjhB (NUDIX family)